MQEKEEQGEEGPKKGAQEGSFNGRFPFLQQTFPFTLSVMSIICDTPTANSSQLSWQTQNC